LTIDPELALDITARLASGASLVASLEMIAVRREFRAAGAFNLKGIASLYSSSPKRFAWIDRHVTAVLVIVAASSAAVLALGPYSMAGRVAIVACLLGRTLVRWRRFLGGDGAEQITTLCLAAATLAVFPMPSHGRINLAVAFIAAQATLSYVTAGIAKVTSPVWRGGDALPTIMATDVHGHPTAAAALQRWRPVATLLGWIVIIFECGFPLFVAGPPALAFGALATGLAFHVACAFTMGLNNFLVAFPATYPCVLVAGGWLSPFY
jgi:hypothetical protein